MKVEISTLPENMRRVVQDATVSRKVLGQVCFPFYFLFFPSLFSLFPPSSLEFSKFYLIDGEPRNINYRIIVKSHP